MPLRSILCRIQPQDRAELWARMHLWIHTKLSQFVVPVPSNHRAWCKLLGENSALSRDLTFVELKIIIKDDMTGMKINRKMCLNSNTTYNTYSLYLCIYGLELRNLQRCKLVPIMIDTIKSINYAKERLQWMNSQEETHNCVWLYKRFAVEFNKIISFIMCESLSSRNAKIQYWNIINLFYWIRWSVKLA